jgi:NADH-quinone oxidoreductase subunit J
VNEAFLLAAAVAVFATAMAVSRLNAVHALLYLVVSLLAVALMFYILGAPFAAALEVIIYAGAIMVLFVFVVMLLNLGGQAVARERGWLTPRIWLGPAGLCAVLLGELLVVLFAGPGTPATPALVDARAVGITLFGPYLLAVELASLLLLAGLVGAWQLGRSDRPGEQPEEAVDADGPD